MIAIKKNKILASVFHPKKFKIKDLVHLLIIAIISIIFNLQLLCPPTLAQTISPLASDQTLQVATRVLPPFVAEENGELFGFSIELWRSIAEQLDVKFEFKKYPNVKQLLEAVAKNQVDLGIAAISITAEREQKFDFSYPIFFSGLQILVRNTQSGAANALQSLLASGSILFSTTIYHVLAVATILSMIMAHVVWLIERNHKESMISKHYFPGIFEAFWWAITALVAQQDSNPNHTLAKIVALFWMFSSVIFLSYFTASFASIMTVQKLQSNIQEFNDLPGHIVATTKGSVAAEFLKRHRIKTVEFSSIEQVYESLLDKKSDAVVFDSPVLKYYANNEGKNKVQLVGEIFNPSNYGIVYSQKSPLRKAVNVALLKLYANGTYQQIYDKYFKKK
jgi:polar amino acid transport system substrate-binding protein